MGIVRSLIAGLIEVAIPLFGGLGILALVAFIFAPIAIADYFESWWPLTLYVIHVTLIGYGKLNSKQ